MIQQTDLHFSNTICKRITVQNRQHKKTRIQRNQSSHFKQQGRQLKVEQVYQNLKNLDNKGKADNQRYDLQQKQVTHQSIFV